MMIGNVTVALLVGANNENYIRKEVSGASRLVLNIKKSNSRNQL